MTAIKVELLRLILPPSQPSQNQAQALPVQCAWRLPGGEWQGSRHADLEAVLLRYRPGRLEISPHPVDVSMVDVELPPLPSKRQRAAVCGAVELLALTPSKELSIGFGPRDTAGKVPVAWTSAQNLETTLHTLKRHGMRVDAILPPPAFLPMPRESDGAGIATGIVVDDWAILRTGPGAGALHPLPAESRARGESTPPSLRPTSGISHVQWQDELGATETSTPWTGTGWNWCLPHDSAGASTRNPAWLMPALGWATAALIVWLAGLNLYAARVAADGHALKRKMEADVKAAFPELTVVLNPLKQARQLRDARNAATETSVAPGFTGLLHASVNLLAQFTAQVQRLDYRDGQIEVRWRDGVTLRPAEIDGLRTQATALGVMMDIGVDTVRLRANPQNQSNTITQGRPENQP